MLGLVGGRGRSPPDDGEFSKICKILLKKIAKTLYFRLFYKDTSNPCIKPSRVWMINTTGWGNFAKILKFNANSIENLNFYLFFGKFLPRNRAIGNTIIFLQQFFRFRRGLNLHNLHAYAPYCAAFYCIPLLRPHLYCLPFSTLSLPFCYIKFGGN